MLVFSLRVSTSQTVVGTGIDAETKAATKKSQDEVLKAAVDEPWHNSGLQTESFSSSVVQLLIILRCFSTFPTPMRAVKGLARTVTGDLITLPPSAPTFAHRMDTDGDSFGALVHAVPFSVVGPAGPQIPDPGMYES